MDWIEVVQAIGGIFYNMSIVAKQIRQDNYKGYIQVVKLLNGKVIKTENLKSYDLDKIKKYKGEKDIYYTPNTSYNGKRGIQYLKELRALYIDIDLKEEVTKEKINFIIAQVWWLAELGEVPRPTRAVFTGRGVHIYWDIIISSYGALATWQELEDYLYIKLKHLGADKQATDGARILRLEYTYNSKNNALCETVVYEEENIYSMYDLRERYLNWSHRKNNINAAVKTKAEDRKIKNLYNSYSLHMARAMDILKLVELRKGNVKGHRNFILHCFAYWKGIYSRNEEELKILVLDLNNSFKEPLKESEVKAILKCIPKAIDRFLDYEQGIRTGKLKRVSRGMRDKGGYWYKNSTLIDKLEITEEEQKHLKSIVGKREKYNRNNMRRTPRNENGLTKKQQELQDLKVEVLKLKAQGLSLRNIAKELNITLGKVQRCIKK